MEVSIPPELVRLAANNAARIIKGKRSIKRIAKIFGVSQESAKSMRAVARYVLSVQDSEGDIKVSGCGSGSLILTESKHALVVTKYSNFDGRPATLGELELITGLPQMFLRKYLRANGITHDSLPLPGDSILHSSVDASVSSLVALRSKEVKDSFDRRMLRSVKENAAKWESLEGSVERVVSRLTTRLPSREVQRLELEKGEREFIVLISPTDLHFGKYGSKEMTGSDFNRSVCRDRLLKSLKRALSKVVKIGVPEKILFVVGSDWFHVDTPAGTTTRGTPQDTDGTWEDIFDEGVELVLEAVEMCLQVAPTAIDVMPGNHDYTDTIAKMKFLQAWYRNTEDVTVTKVKSHRRYRRYGNNLIGLTHGDGPKFHELPDLMASDVPDMWGKCKNHMWFTGNFHHEMSKDFRGCQVMQMPSLSGTDRWHAQNGFVNSVKSLIAYVIYKDTGCEDTLRVPTPNEDFRVDDV
jgi:hypothetical protein